MGMFMDCYEIIKDLLAEAKKLKDVTFIEKVLLVQESFFYLREENEKLKLVVKDQNEVNNKLETTLEELNSLKLENERLKETIKVEESLDDLSYLNKEISVKYVHYSSYIKNDVSSRFERVEVKTLKEIFSNVAPNIFVGVKHFLFSDCFEIKIDGFVYHIDDKIYGKLKAKFLEKNLIEIKEKKDETFIQITEYGRMVFNKINNL